MERQHVLAVLHEHHAYLQKLVFDIHEHLRQLAPADDDRCPPHGTAADSSHPLLLLAQCLSAEAAFFHRRLQAFLTAERPLSGQAGERSARHIASEGTPHA